MEKSKKPMAIVGKLIKVTSVVGNIRKPIKKYARTKELKTGA